jgi:hypothetical protein
MKGFAFNLKETSQDKPTTTTQSKVEFPTIKSENTTGFAEMIRSLHSGDSNLFTGLPGF